MQRGDVFESHEKDIADVLVISELDDRDLEDHLRDIDSEKECESLFFFCWTRYRPGFQALSSTQNLSSIFKKK